MSGGSAGHGPALLGEIRGGIMDMKPMPEAGGNQEGQTLPASTPLAVRANPVRYRVYQFVVIWLMAEVLVGGLGPVLLPVFERTLSEHYPGLTIISLRTAGALAVMSTALAAARIPDLLESKSDGNSIWRALILLSIILTLMISLVIGAQSEVAEGTGLTHPQILRVFITSAIALVLTLAIGIGVQVQRARAEERAEEPVSIQVYHEPVEPEEKKPDVPLVTPPLKQDPPDRPDNPPALPHNPPALPRPAVYAGIVLGAMIGYSLGRLSRG